MVRARTFEILGFATVIRLIAVNSVDWTYLLAFFLVAVVTSQVLNATALLIEEIGFRRYHSKDLALLAAWGSSRRCGSDRRWPGGV